MLNLLRRTRAKISITILMHHEADTTLLLADPALNGRFAQPHRGGYGLTIRGLEDLRVRVDAAAVREERFLVCWRKR